MTDEVHGHIVATPDGNRSFASAEDVREYLRDKNSPLRDPNSERSRESARKADEARAERRSRRESAPRTMSPFVRRGM